MADTPRLNYVSRGTARTVRGAPDALHLPITIDILVRLFHVWKAPPNHYWASLLWAAATFVLWVLVGGGIYGRA